MRLRTLPLALAALLAAAPARAQHAAPFPGIAWGVTADSVIRAWGEPSSRGTTSDGLDELSYDAWNDRPGTRYVLVHESLGVVIAGYAVPFAGRNECRKQAHAALLRAAGDYPALVWVNSGVPDAGALCHGTLASSGAYARDPESGTRIGIRMNRAGTALVMDALSTAGFDWVGTA